MLVFAFALALSMNAPPQPSDEPEHMWRFRSENGVEALVTDRAGEGGSVVRLRYHDGEARALSLADLDAALEPGEDGGWLADVPRPARLRQDASFEAGEAYLDLYTRAGLVAVDVRDGTSFRAGALGQTRRIDLRFGGVPGLEGNVAQPYVDSVTVLGTHESGAPVVVALKGHHPTPGWGIVGYGIELGEPRRDGARRLLVTPLAVAPSGFAHAQVLDPFESQLEVLHLPPGEYAVEVDTRDGTAAATEPFVVRPPRLVCALEASGGILGMHERTELYANGWARLVDRRSRRPGRGSERSLRVEPERDLRIRELLARLPGRSAERLEPTGADLVTYELAWGEGDERFALRVDDATVDGVERELFDALSELR